MEKELKYIKNGDYYVPDIKMDPEPEGDITKFGILRENFLKEHRKGIYTAHKIKCDLKQHLLSVQEQAEERMDIIMEQMCKAEGVDEALKESNQMEWVRKMNMIKAQAEEIVLNEIIYV